MKFMMVLVAMTVTLQLHAARVVALPELPDGVLSNSEVVTNIALDVNAERLEKLTFSLELDASASNSLSIAVGAASGDALTLEEADFEWGALPLPHMSSDPGDTDPRTKGSTKGNCLFITSSDKIKVHISATERQFKAYNTDINQR